MNAHNDFGLCDASQCIIHSGVSEILSPVASQPFHLYGSEIGSPYVRLDGRDPGGRNRLSIGREIGQTVAQTREVCICLMNRIFIIHANPSMII